MKGLNPTLFATILTLAIASTAAAGTITGSKSGTITGSKAGTITGSKSGTITGSKNGTITGSKTGTITGSRTDAAEITLLEIFRQESLASALNAMFRFAW